MRCRMLLLEDSGDLEAGDSWQLDVGQHNVRLVDIGQANCFIAGRGFRDNMELAALFEQASDTLSEEWMIIDDHD